MGLRKPFLYYFTHFLCNWRVYFVSEKETAEPRIRIALEKAARYHANAVFFRTFPEGDNRSPLPQIYIYHAIDLDVKNAWFAEIHRRLWNAGVVPLAFILNAGNVKIFNCRQEPIIDRVTNNPILTPFSHLEKLVEVDRVFVAREISSGVFWENPKFKKDFVLKNTAYFKLLNHLRALRQELLKKNILPEPTANRILVMAMLVKYLNDRQDSEGNRVFKKGFLCQFSSTDHDDLESLFREKGGCTKLFKHLSEHFNGGIFELTDSQQSELGQVDLSIIADFLKGDQENSGQRLFWPLYSFEDLPVELISNIYEEFLAEKKGGIVYTPPMLVDFLLDQCLPLQKEALKWKILDPACGSGIFLVGAFKRLVQCWKLANNWKQPTHIDLKEILKKSIFGFDEKSEAVLIAAFSLCVALCDELEPKVIWNELKFDNLQNRNLQDRDFFEIVESEEFDNYFDLVIGNPPFESKLITEAGKRIELDYSKQRPKLPDPQIALLFLEQSFRLVSSNSMVCLIQPAGPLLYNRNAIAFRGYLFNKYSINQVFDFTPLESVLFPNVKVAAAAIVGFNAPPSTDKISHITFRRTKAIKEKLIFELDPYDFHWVNREIIHNNQLTWKANLLGGGRLHRLLDRLFSDMPTIGEYLEEKQSNDGWKVGEGYNIGCGNELNKVSDDHIINDLIKMSPKDRRKMFGLKQNPKLAPWITGKSNLPPEALTQEGINWEAVNICTNLFFERTRSDNKLIFLPPHVLIREKPEGSSIPAVYSDKELVFSKQIIGIHAPDEDEEQLKNLAHNLNRSELYGVLAAIFSTRMLIGRASSLLKSDIMALPYNDKNVIDLNTWEQVIIDDIFNYLIEFRRKGENALVLTEVSESELNKFGEIYCSILNSVYKKFQKLQPIQMGSFICYPFCFGNSPQIEIPNHTEIVSFLNELLHRKHGNRLFINRILRLYDHNLVFMIKPNQKRYWLPSIALRDADETLVDLFGQGY